ncbi:MAG: hypothetical protein LIP08_06155 [Bacteroides sp.]|nr:hypothetical protein [Bacteroides sp.]
MNKLKIYNLLWLFACLLTWQGCSDDDKGVLPPGPDDESFYAPPFQGMPALSDVSMYQVNLRAFAPKNSLQEVTS